MKTIECSTQAQLDKALKNRKADELIVCVGGTRNRPLVARGSSRIVARESSHVEARGSSRIVARESSHVVAWGSSHVVARGSSHVVAWGSSHVEAWESSHVVAWGSSHVVARGSSHVVAWGSSHVEAWGSSHVMASPYVAVTKQPSHRGTVNGGVIIEIPEVHTAAEWCAYNGVKASRGLVTLFKAVDDEFRSGYGLEYQPGSKAKCDDWNTLAECGGGLHFTAHPLISQGYFASATRFVACPVKVSELVVIDNEKVKAPRVAGVIFEVDRGGRRL